MSKDDFFIGWADTPTPDRRFFLASGLALLGGTAVTATTLSSRQSAPGRGIWTMGDVRDWHGVITATPYPMLRTLDLDGTPRTVLLSALGKCGVSARIGALAGQSVVVQGSLIARGRNAMIAVKDGLDWIARAAPNTEANLTFPQIETLGDVTLRGEILDSKCWFGAMRPSAGKVHKSCASLCIRGGLPPAFYVKDRKNQKVLMIMTDRGHGHSTDLLPFVADPVEITATAQRWGNLILLDGPVSAIERV